MNAALPLALAILLAAPAARAADPASITAASGAELFARFCTSCHGDAGRGDGPVAGSLKVRPADLTAIAARAGGAFPADDVREMIDGRAPLPAHGPREMPVWGYEFEARAPEDAPGRAAAQDMTDRLVDYLRSIQR
jgi:mono/diheme cytochrome c family protein